MPTWSGVLKEIDEAKAKKRARPFDTVRRKHLKQLHGLTKRNVILYATAFTSGLPFLQQHLGITDEDIQGLMEVVHGLPDDPCDLILHSPGGSVEAAEAIVEYLHTQYPHIRAFIPHMAMSAGTMIACGMNEIMMGKHSNMGPIDPQIYVPFTQSFEPAQAIIEQFKRAIEKCPQDGQEGWAAMLRMYGPSLVVQCEQASKLSKQLVEAWLSRWMFEGEHDRLEKASSIAEKLADRKAFLTHSRHIRRDQALEMGLKVSKLEKDEKLQDLVLSVFHATTQTFEGAKAVKIIENHLGKAFIKTMKLVQPPPPPH